MRARFASASLSIAAVILPVASTALVGAAPAQGAEVRSTLTRTIGDSRITESSGLARSTYARDILYTHNDSGDSPRLFAIGRTGKVRAVYRIANASARDWEDISTGPGHNLWIGDIGDNSRRRSHVTVYRVPEPTTVRSRSLRATSYNLKYPDGAKDAEGLMVNPKSGRLFIVSKNPNRGKIYRAPKRLSSSRMNHLKVVRSAPLKVTAASFAPGGSRFIVRNYTSAFVFDSMKARARVLRLPGTRQGESLEVGRRWSTIFTGSEGRNSPVWRTLY